MRFGCCQTRRISGTAGWLVPAAILAVLPKCPMCMVVYFAMFTGFGLSMATAAHIRVVIVVMCAAFLILFTARRILAFRSRPT